jgi:hypothetical protein
MLLLPSSWSFLTECCADCGYHLLDACADSVVAVCVQLVPTGGSDLSIRTTAANGEECVHNNVLCVCAHTHHDGVSRCFMPEMLNEWMNELRVS